MITGIWTEEEKLIVRNSYKPNIHSAEDVAKLLNRRPRSVAYMLDRLGLRRCRRKMWTEKEEKQLESLVGRTSAAMIAKRLHRSLNAVQIHISKKKLGSNGCREGWYTQNDVANIFRVSHRWVGARIKDGTIKAERYTSDEGQWYIKEKDLREYIITHTWELNGLLVDIQQVVWIITHKE